MPSDLHQSIIELAGRYLRTLEYRVQIPDARKRFGEGMRGECPDLVCWRTFRDSAIVEVKVSASDAVRDRSKLSRADGRGMGNHRYLFSPAGVLNASHVPPMWSWFEVLNNEPHERIEGIRFNVKDRDSEGGLLLAHANRLMWDSQPQAKQRKGGKATHGPGNDFAAIVREYDAKNPGDLPKFVVKNNPGLVSMAGNKVRAIAMVGAVRQMAG